MRTLRYIFAAIAVTWIVGVPGASAQQQPQQQPSQPSQQQSSQQTQQQSQQSPDQTAAPIPALRSPLSLGEDNGSAAASADPNALAPDERSLVGAQDLSLGAPKTGHSYWAPYFQLSSTLDSNPLSGSGGPGWTTWTTFYGGLDMHRRSGNSDLDLTYLGGGSISTDAGTNTATVQQFGVADALKFHRSEIVFLDQLAYTPEASFGYAGIGGPNLQVGGNIGLQSGFTPDQSILTSLGQRISNAFATEGDVFLTPRSFLTFVGSYSVLDFFGNNLNNNNESSVRAGYNYRMSPKDTIALSYRFGAFRYDHIPQSINDHSVQFSYARRVTGRLAFQIGGGPDIAFSQTPITSTSGSSTVTSTTPATKTRQFFWSLNSYATYQLRRAMLTGLYSHGVSGGSGVLAGSVSDSVSGSASRMMTSTVRGALNVGYSRNRGVAIPGLNGTPIIAFIPSSQTYDYWFGGVSFSRSLGRSATLYIYYQVNTQNSNASFCVTITCGKSYIGHQISMSLGWNPRPMAF